MDRESMERLRFDRRLQHRRDWVAEGEYEALTESLPDVSSKMTRGSDESEGAEGTASRSAASGAPTSTASGEVSRAGSFPDSGGSSTPA